MRQEMKWRAILFFIAVAYSFLNSTAPKRAHRREQTRPPYEVELQTERESRPVTLPSGAARGGLLTSASGEIFGSSLITFPYRKGACSKVTDNDGKLASYSALGTNGQCAYDSAFFADYAPPVKVGNPWLVMGLVADRLRYQWDAKLFGLIDVWQTGPEAWKRGQGDCEDHSLLIADWLSVMGYDARVVVGETKDGGHAWVVIFDAGKVYLVESTSKYPPRIPAFAELKAGYFPKYMFNSREFWQNTGGPGNLNYQSAAWVKRSRFTPYRNDSDRRNDTAISFLQRNEPVKALEALNGGTGGKPSSERMYLLGRTYLGLNRRTEAAEAFKEARRLGFTGSILSLRLNRLGSIP